MLCAGLVDGIAYAAPGLCIPDSAKYIDDRPARMHADFNGLAFEALQAAWPCKK
jgi:hypothetical protein